MAESEALPKSLRILCFGDSLTAGFTKNGEEHHPYADHLRAGLQHTRFVSDVKIDVAGFSGDTVVQGLYVRRMKRSCEVAGDNPYDWIIVMGGTNDLAWGEHPDVIYNGLKNVWRMALGTGANVLALTVLEASVVNESLDSNRNALNAQILRHKEDRFHTFDLFKAIPYHSLSEDERERLWDDGLHLTREGYKMMGDFIAVHILELLQSAQQRKDTTSRATD